MYTNTGESDIIKDKEVPSTIQNPYFVWLDFFIKTPLFILQFIKKCGRILKEL